MTRTHRRQRAIVTAGALLVLAVACSRTAYTGRLQTTYRSDDEDVALADQAVASYRLSVRPASQPALTERVDRVLHALIEAAKAGPAADRAQHLTWQSTVVESPEPTVASFPNGTLFVSTALLRVLDDDAALAAALGHAVARVLLRHGAEGATRYAREGALGMIPTGTGFGSSRTERGEEREAEADWVGIVLAVDAGYDADRAVALFDRLGWKERGDRVRKRLPELHERSAKAPTRSAQLP